MGPITDKETVKEIYETLLESSCCPRCVVRFLGLTVSEDEAAFRAPEDFFAQFDIKIHSDSGAKKMKKNCCAACLNCFDVEEVHKFAEKLKGTNVHEYNYNTYMLNVSFPKCFALRTRSIFLHLKQKFPTVPLFQMKVVDVLGAGLEQPHKIFRSVSSKIYNKALDKEYSPKSNLTILMVLGYDNDEMEIKKLGTPAKTKKPNKKKLRYEKIKPKLPVSRGEILELLKDLSTDQFKKYYPIPPDIPTNGVFVEDISIQTDPVFLGGRYFKFARNVGQTPWIVDGVSLSEHNIQDIMFDAIQKVAKIEKSQMTFTSSGREDVDVRMLGSGRPFYIKIDKLKKYRISNEDLLKIQEEIIKTDLAAVIKLQHVYASEIKRIKFGENEKTKTYKALCHTKASSVKDVVDGINKHSTGVDIIQTTALRVLHRRTLLDRERRIYSMTATTIPGQKNLFELDLETQAGTYVKEFVHGDFDRTKPSISSIVGYPTDIIALDCVDVHLEWPEDDQPKNKISNTDIKSETETDDITKIENV